MRTQLDENQIRSLAYRLWQDRGYTQEGFEQDWFEAERLLLLVADDDAFDLDPSGQQEVPKIASKDAPGG